MNIFPNRRLIVNWVGYTYTLNKHGKRIESELRNYHVLVLLPTE